MSVLCCSAHADVVQRWSKAVATIDQAAAIHSVGELINRLQEDEEQLVLLHISLQGLDGIAGVGQLKTRFSKAILFVFSDRPSDREGIALVKMGVSGYTNTYIRQDLLANAVSVVQAGEVWIGQRLMERLIIELAGRTRPESHLRHQELDKLSERELEIAHLVAAGANNKQIAARLGITERTVKAHLSSIFQKTKQSDRLQLALLVNGFR